MVPWQRTMASAKESRIPTRAAIRESEERRTSCSAQNRRFETGGGRAKRERRGWCAPGLGDLDTKKSDGHSAGLCFWGILRWPWQRRSLRRRRRWSRCYCACPGHRERLASWWTTGELNFRPRMEVVVSSEADGEGIWIWNRKAGEARCARHRRLEVEGCERSPRLCSAFSVR